LAIPIFCAEVQSDAGQKSSFAYSFRRSRGHNLETTEDAPLAILSNGRSSTIVQAKARRPLRSKLLRSYAIAWGSSGKHAAYLQKLTKCISKAGDADRKLIMAMTQKIAGRRNRHASPEA